MIDIATKIHDDFSIELKVGFVTRKKLRMNDFSLAMWIFVPGGLDISRSTYPKKMFYQDVKSNIRLITPVFLLRDIAGGDAVPLVSLRHALEEMSSSPSRTRFAECEYQVKMFVAIVKSALRDDLAHIRQNRIPGDREGLCARYVENAENIMKEYAGLRSIINVSSVSDETLKTYLYGDEFLCDIMGKHLLDLISWMRENGLPDPENRAVALYRRIDAHKSEMGYSIIQPDDPLRNRTFLHRFNVLKKYIESILYLRAAKKRDGVLIEQLYLSVAAGVAMIFATVISFAFQRKFGSLTLPLFIALIISYMLKDRIKELTRYYFAHRIGSKYFDNKAKIRHKETTLGWLKEGVDFISAAKVPPQIMTIRNNSYLTEIENNITTEKILLYRKSVHIDREKLQQGSTYVFSGINDIIQLNVKSFTKMMNNPRIPMKTLDADGNLQIVGCDRVYFLNMILQYRYDDSIEYRRLRVAISRKGIQSIEEVQ
jgi:hypothetical protein